jgi:sugar-specific transcriptional regulator TrmB
LSLERIYKTLIKIGLSQIESRVYIHLAACGPAKARTIIFNLSIKKQQLYRSLRSLKTKKLVNYNLEFPVTFSAVSFKEALKILIKMKDKQAQQIEEKKDGFLSLWNSITIKD